ncbi:MAG: TlpA disulfide reductase family protein [Pyrinomonadaceae bacterium]
MNLLDRSAPRFWTRSRLFFTIGVLALIAGLGFSGCNSTEKNANSTNQAGDKPVGPRDTSKLTPVPAEALNMELRDTEGKTLKLSEYAGKVVIVNLWATWCGPCRIETPELVRMSQEFKDRGVEVIGLTTQNNDADVELIKDFLKENKVPYRTIYDDGKFASSLSIATNARGVIPQSYVITRDGKFLTHFEGFDPRSTPNKMRQMIELALTYKT